jgi:hypothetical protein
MGPDIFQLFILRRRFSYSATLQYISWDGVMTDKLEESVSGLMETRPRHLPGGTEEKQNKPYSGLSVYR